MKQDMLSAFLVSVILEFLARKISKLQYGIGAVLFKLIMGLE